jgi:hypothetical protein
VPASDYLEGLAFFALTFGGVLGGAWLLLGRRFAGLAGAPRVVAFGMLATLGALAVHLLPAACGVLGRWEVLAATALWVAAALLTPAVPGTAEPERRPQPSADRFTRVPAAVGVGALGLYVLAVARNQLTLAPLAIDTLNFHLPGVARWIQTGSIWQIDVFLPDVAPGHYPNNGDVMLLAAILPWRNDFLAHFAMYPFYALTGVGVYALARELGASRALAALSGCLLLAIPAVAVPALVGSLVDALMLAAFAAGILFLVRHRRTGSTAELVLAGLSLGVSFGTKWYAVTSVAAVVAVWAGASLVAGRGWRLVVRQGLALSGLVSLSGGIWLIRNWVQSGNPVFPVKVAPFGITVFDAPHDPIREQAGFTIVDYLDQPDVWADFLLPAFRDALGAPAALAGAGLLLAAALRRRGLPLAGVVCAGLLVAAYSVTPYTAGGPRDQPVLAGADARYLVPALVVAAALGAWAAGSLRRAAPVAAVLAVAAVVDGIVLTSGGERGSAELVASDWGGALLVGAALLAAVRLGPRLRPRRLTLAAVALVAAVALAALGHDVQRRFNEKRYGGIEASVEWLVQHADSGHRVGLAGLWTDELSPVLPAFGPRFRNEVEYVGSEDRDMLRRYTDRDDFIAALRRRRYDLLVVGRGRPGVPEGPEQDWAFAAGFERVALSDQLALFRAPRANP